MTVAPGEDDELGDERDWLRRVFERAREGIAVVDASGRVVRANPALEALLGPPEPVVGSVLWDRVCGGDARVMEDLAPLRAGERARVETERCYRGPLGRPVRLRETASLLLDTPRAGGEAWMIVTLEELEEPRPQPSLAYLGQMAAVVTHEVRNALAGIRSAVEVIGYGLPPRSEERMAVDEVRQRIADLDESVGHMLRFARPRAPALCALSTHGVLSAVAARLGASRFAARLEVEGPDAWVEGDPDLLMNALLDLCVNAVQAGGPGGVVRVSVVTGERVGQDALGQDALGQDRLGQNTVELWIRDWGAGIPPELQEQVFEPFFTTRSRGVGLGLPMARRIAEAHGGELRIAESDAGGTTIVIRLRRAERAR